MQPTESRVLMLTLDMQPTEFRAPIVEDLQLLPSALLSLAFHQLERVSVLDVVCMFLPS